MPGTFMRTLARKLMTRSVRPHQYLALKVLELESRVTPDGSGFAGITDPFNTDGRTKLLDPFLTLDMGVNDRGPGDGPLLIRHEYMYDDENPNTPAIQAPPDFGTDLSKLYPDQVPVRPVTVQGLVVQGLNNTNVGNQRVVSRAPTGHSTQGDPDLWADKGHVMAASLGGSNEQSNLFPQWYSWNENGAWKRVELGLATLAQNFISNGLRGYFTSRVDVTLAC